MVIAGWLEEVDVHCRGSIDSFAGNMGRYADKIESWLSAAILFYTMSGISTIQKIIQFQSLKLSETFARIRCT